MSPGLSVSHRKELRFSDKERRCKNELWNKVEGVGRLRVIYPPGNEGGAGLLRCDDALRCPWNLGSHLLEARYSLGD